MPTFSFIIPVKPHGAVKALESLRQVEDQQSFEVLVAEGRHPSIQRNLAAKSSSGDILYFLDDDSRVAADCLTQCARAMADPSVAVAGGPSLTPASDSRLQHLFGYALASPFGAGGVRNRYRAVGQPRLTTEKELILCNLAFRREVFLAAGGLDERLYPNEENELLDRISASGHGLMHVPAMGVMRSQRAKFSAFARQMFSYGCGRARQTLIAGPRSPMSFIPLAFVIYLALLPWAYSYRLANIPLLTYLSLDILFTCLALAGSGSPTAICLLFLFPLMHCANGIGLLYGFLEKRARPASPPDVAIRRVKEFGQTAW